MTDIMMITRDSVEIQIHSAGGRGRINCYGRNQCLAAPGGAGGALLGGAPQNAKGVIIVTSN